jgi:hypothetical protein
LTSRIRQSAWFSTRPCSVSCRYPPASWDLFYETPFRAENFTDKFSSTNFWYNDQVSPGDPSPGDPSPGDPSPGDPSPGDPSPGDPSPGDPLPPDPSPNHLSPTANYRRLG